MSMFRSLSDAAAPVRPPAAQIPLLQGLGKRLPCLSTLDGMPFYARFRAPEQAPGIAIHHQELNFVLHRGGAENRDLRRAPKRGRCVDMHRAPLCANRPDRGAFRAGRGAPDRAAAESPARERLRALSEKQSAVTE
ncbi:hypothetical protein [Burkholderia glumae]